MEEWIDWTESYCSQIWPHATLNYSLNQMLNAIFFLLSVYLCYAVLFFWQTVRLDGSSTFFYTRYIYITKSSTCTQTSFWRLFICVCSFYATLLYLRCIDHRFYPLKTYKQPSRNVAWIRFQTSTTHLSNPLRQRFVFVKLLIPWAIRIWSIDFSKSKLTNAQVLHGYCVA